MDYKLTMATNSKKLLEPIQVSKPKILVIDDSRLIRSAAVKMFGSDFELELAVDGREGWEKIQRDSSIQVVFSDLAMPELDGFEVLELVRTSKDEGIRNQPVIVITGADNTEEAKEKAFSMGATDFITKPFNATDIKARARTHAQYRCNTKQLEQNTTIDTLTGLINKKGLYQQLDKDISFVTRHSEDLTVMMIELDLFEDLFVKIGRSGAEAIVKKVSRVITQAVRKEDTVARTGLASFVVSMPMARNERSLDLADRICQKVELFRASLKLDFVIPTSNTGHGSKRQVSPRNSLG